MSATHHDFIRRGLTYRRFHYAVQQGWLIPDNPDCGSGKQMRFPWSEVRVAELMVRLMDFGMHVEKAAWLARHPAEGAAVLRELADTVEGAVVSA